MNTIAKGKINSKVYFLSDYLIGLGLYPNYWYREEDIEDNILKIQQWDDMKHIYSKSVVSDWETFFKADYLEYTLNVGDSIFINDSSYKIEKIEGTDDNTIIYYVDKILKEDEDLASLEESKLQLQNLKNQLIESNQKALLERRSSRISKESKKRWCQFGK
jgi:hypothetical protein